MRNRRKCEDEEEEEEEEEERTTQDCLGSFMGLAMYLQEELEMT
jgi:hypothetical protein